MKRLIGRLAAAVTAVILAASMGISSYAAGEGDPDPILYNIKAEEGEEYLELKEASASEDGEESAQAGSSKGAEPEENPEEEESAEESEEEEEESEEESEDKGSVENASTGTTGSGEAVNSVEPEKEAPSNKYILVVAIPGDGSYDEFDAIHLTVNYQDAAAGTAEIHLDELTPADTDKGEYYIVRYGLSSYPLKDVTAEGVKVENELPAGTTQGELVDGETKETTKKLTVEFGTVTEKSGEEAASVATTTASTAATTATTEENALSGNTDDSDNEGGFNWIPIVIVGAVLLLAAIGGAILLFLHFKKKQPETRDFVEPAIVLGTCSELRAVEERGDGQCDYYRFDFDGRLTVRLADLQNKTDGKRLDFIRGTDLEDVVVQAYGKELTFFRQSGNREENLFVLAPSHSMAEFEVGEGRTLRFIWIPGIKEDP